MREQLAAAAKQQAPVHAEAGSTCEDVARKLCFTAALDASSSDAAAAPATAGGSCGIEDMGVSGTAVLAKPVLSRRSNLRQQVRHQEGCVC